jgi:hypothetical protein
MLQPGTDGNDTMMRAAKNIASGILQITRAAASPSSILQNIYIQNAMNAPFNIVSHPNHNTQEIPGETKNPITSFPAPPWEPC